MCFRGWTEWDSPIIKEWGEDGKNEIKAWLVNKDTDLTPEQKKAIEKLLEPLYEETIRVP